jgi:hypothetical protein
VDEDTERNEDHDQGVDIRVNRWRNTMSEKPRARAE